MIKISWEKIDLLSLDIFDTLLFRATARFDGIFPIVWEKVCEQKLNGIDISPTEYQKLRIEMERRARNKAKNREIFIQSIFDEMPSYIAKDKNELKRIEYETEQEYCYVNKDILALVQEAKSRNVKVVLTSDMYFNQKEMRGILEKNQVDTTIFDDIIISCEYGCNKQNGALYQILSERHPQVAKARMLHIGDNRSSDYEQAVKSGLQAIHYQAIPDQMYSVYDYEKLKHNIPLPELLSLRKVTVYGGIEDNKNNTKTPEITGNRENTAYEIGAGVVGPFLSLYVSWVVDRMAALKINRIYPLMREGYLLGELLKREAANRSLEIEVKPIYISRKVTYLPAIQKIDREEIENMIGARNLTIGEAILLMGLSENDFEEFTDFFGMKLKESHKVPYGNTTLKEAFISAMLQESNVAKTEQYVKEQRRLLNTYLIQQIGELKGAATIDIGFFGRIQMWMEQSLHMDGIDTRMTHFLAIGVTGDKIYNGHHFEGYVSTITENSDLVSTIHRTTDVLEKLISVTEGSTVGYEEVCSEQKVNGNREVCCNQKVNSNREACCNQKMSSSQERNSDQEAYNHKKAGSLLEEECTAGKIHPIKGNPVHNDILPTVFEGIFDFQNRWFDFREQKPQIARQCVAKRREALMILHRLIDMPRRAEAELFTDMQADTNFGTNYAESVITEKNIALLKEKGADYIDKCNVSYTYENSNVVWPKGLITLEDEFYYVRKVLKEKSTNEIMKSMQEVVERVEADGIKEAALYGAGENGRQFLFICHLYGIKVNCFIDRKESLWGTQKEGIPVMGLMEAMEKQYDAYIVTSLFSIDEIRKKIEKEYENTDRRYKIYSV